MASVLLVLALLATSAISQDTAHVSWQHPQTYTDDSALPINEIQNTMVFWSNSTCDPQQLIASPNNVIVDAPANDVITPTLGIGTWCFVARTLAINNPNPSGPSNVATKIIRADPRAPGMLFVEGDNQAYQVIQSRDSIALIPVGTVPPGTQCNGMIIVADRNGVLAYLVPRASVTWFGNVEPEAVFSRCGT